MDDKTLNRHGEELGMRNFEDGVIQGIIDDSVVNLCEEEQKPQKKNGKGSSNLDAKQAAFLAAVSARSLP